ncbi:hypothetical protein ACFLZZ_02495 [Nanoarchaeota archaeon]
MVLIALKNGNSYNFQDLQAYVRVEFINKILDPLSEGIAPKDLPFKKGSEAYFGEIVGLMDKKILNPSEKEWLQNLKHLRAELDNFDRARYESLKGETREIYTQRFARECATTGNSLMKGYKNKPGYTSVTDFVEYLLNKSDPSSILVEDSKTGIKRPLNQNSFIKRPCLEELAQEIVCELNLNPLENKTGKEHNPSKLYKRTKDDQKRITVHYLIDSLEKDKKKISKGEYEKITLHHSFSTEEKSDVGVESLYITSEKEEPLSIKYTNSDAKEFLKKFDSYLSIKPKNMEEEFLQHLTKEAHKSTQEKIKKMLTSTIYVEYEKEGVNEKIKKDLISLIKKLVSD